MHEITEEDVRLARERSHERSSIVVTMPKPSCKLIGKPLDRYIMIDQVLRSLYKLGRQRDVQKFGSWSSNTRLSPNDILAEADRVCNIY